MLISQSLCVLKKPNAFLKEKDPGAGEMAQWIKALTALPEVLSSIPSNNRHNPMPSSGVAEERDGVLTYIK